MTFRFKLFKALTGINLFITGFSIMMNFASMLMGAFSQGLVSIVMLGGVFIHAILSAYLQRSLQEPGFTLKENTPGGIRIMGGYTILIGALMLLSGIAIFIVMNLDLKQASSQITEEQRQQLETIRSLKGTAMTMMQFFLFLYGASIVTNALLSLSFLKQWKKKQEDDKHIDLDLDA
ncbi:hypothetical protein [Chitinophaga filiformis]|uniref:Uncharacterized protein n=1 Tax=Chitinophaga filiformis TaxID=104663 RepID=A0A1G7HZZ7_CHIFI|nr:hypothetical protein [Chitinophaga filiformis]SDF05903.1 hypothetical protein SAMN04488121_101662 [Chitinophaga filiformis]